jgi:uncharacterized protein
MRDIHWAEVAAQLDADGVAVIPQLLTPENCLQLRGTYPQAEHFRSRVVMQRHQFGQGEYQYFRYPLPNIVEQRRTQLYAQLAGIANDWSKRLGQPASYPPAHAQYLAHCHAAGQSKPTPLLLHYGAGDFNCLHQDLYGALAFPLQVVTLLSQPGHDFGGGELVLVEQRPRRQSRVQVVPLQQGDAAIFAVNQRPMAGSRGNYRVTLRHGVSRVHWGERYTLGLIFHDAA